MADPPLLRSGTFGSSQRRRPAAFRQRDSQIACENHFKVWLAGRSLWWPID
jgi:hypothetical protein